MKKKTILISTLLVSISLIGIWFVLDGNKASLSKEQEELIQEYPEVFKPTVQPQIGGPGAASGSLVYGITGWWDFGNPRCSWDYLNGYLYNLANKWSKISYEGPSGGRFTKAQNPLNLIGSYYALELTTGYTDTFVPSDIFNASAGTFLVYVRPDRSATEHSTEYLLDHDNLGNAINLYRNEDSGVWSCSLGNSSVTSTGTTSQARATWALVGVRWDGTNQSILYNGIVEDTDVYTGLSSLGSIAYIGSDSNETNFFKGIILGPFTWNRALSDAEVWDLYNRIKSFYMGTSPIQLIWPEYKITEIVGSVSHADLADAYSVAISPSGNYAYVGTYSGGKIITVDISDPTNPSYVTTYTSATRLAGGIRHLFVDGAYLYATGWTGDSMEILALSDETSPSYVGSYTSSTYTDGPDGLWVEGDFAYVSNAYDNMFTILNITNKASPSLAGSVSDATYLDNPRGIVKHGNYCYVTSWGTDGPYTRLTTIDVSNPASPFIAGYSTENSDFFQEGKYVARKENAVYSTEWHGRVLTLDITTATPNLLKRGIMYNNPVLGGETMGICSYEDRLYVAGNESNGFVVCDISSPLEPDMFTYFEDETYLSGIAKIQVDADGQYLWCAVRTAGKLTSVFVGNLEPKTDYHLVGYVEDETYLVQPSYITLKGNYAYITDDDWSRDEETDRLTIVDISFPSNPIVRGSIQDDGTDRLKWSRGVDITSDGNYALVGTASGYVSSFNVSDKDNITYLDLVATGSGSARYGKFKNDNCFVMAKNSSDSVVTVNATNKSNLSESDEVVSSTYLDGAYGLDIFGDYAFVTANNKNPGYLTAISIANPVDISITGNFTHAKLANPLGVEIVSTATTTTAWVVATGILMGVDIHDPTSMSLAGYVEDTINIYTGGRISIIDTTAYVTSATSQLVAIDISDPANPVVVGWPLLQTKYTNYGSFLDNDGTYLYASGYFVSGIAIFDPTWIKTAPVPGEVIP